MWLYKEKVIETIEDFGPDAFGFIYITTHKPSGISYIGKKSLYHISNKKLSKKESTALPIARGRKATTKKVTKESDWKTYYGSADEVNLWVKTTSIDKLTRVVLRLYDNQFRNRSSVYRQKNI